MNSFKTADDVPALLAPDREWWQRGNCPQYLRRVRQIVFAERYLPDAAAPAMRSWDASSAKNGSVTVFLTRGGKQIVIAGNGRGKIVAAASMKGMFAEFTALQEIKGISDFLDFSNVTDMSSCFFHCCALKKLDLSPCNVSPKIHCRGIFFGCNALQELKTWPGFRTQPAASGKSIILEKLAQSGFIIVSPVTGSMRPLIRPKIDQVVFQPKTRYRKNDVALYKSEDGSKLFMHRIEKVLEQGYRIRGDNARYSEYVPRESVFASGTAIYRKNRKIPCSSPAFRVLSLLCVNYNLLLFEYRYSTRFFWRAVRKIKRTLFS